MSYKKQELESFNSMTGLRSTVRSTDMHKAWSGRPPGRPMLHKEENPVMSVDRAVD